MRLTPEEAAEYRECAQSPIYTLLNYGYLKHIVKGRMKWIPYDWQIELIEGLFEGRNYVILKSRQVGASWTIAFYVAWLIHFRPDIEILLLSQNEKKAIKLLYKVRFICVNFPDFIRREFNADSKLRLSVIHRRSGGDVSSESSVDSLTTTSSSGRGDTAAFIFMDEMAHMERSDEVYTAVKPATSHGGQIVIASSPNGPEGVYPRIWFDAENGESSTFTPMRVHYTDCGFDEEWLAEASDGMSEEDILQEYELSFIGGGSPAFDPVHLKNCYVSMDQIMSDPELAEIKVLVLASRKYASGVDSAEIKANRGKRRRDYNAVTALNEHGIQIHAEANKMLLDEWAGNTVGAGDGAFEIVGYVSKWHKRFPGLMYIEENSSGLVVENRHILPEDGVSDVSVKRTTNKRKSRLVNQFRLAIAAGNVLITDKRTWYQLTIYQDLGGGKFSAPPSSHDDLVIAILEAWDALIAMGGYEFTMPQIEKAGAFEVAREYGVAPTAPPIPSPGLDSAFEILPVPQMSSDEWYEFMPTGANVDRIRELI